MSVPAAYAAVVIIWSTTPLAVKWSAEGLAPVSGVFLRMLIATCVGLLVLRVMDKKIRWDKEALKHYGVANIGIFVGMMLIYKASTYMPSGLISVLFGLSPIISGMLAQKLLNDPKFSVNQWVAMMLSLLGLTVVFSEQFQLGGTVHLGITLVLLSVFMFCLSGVLIKKLDVDMDPVASTVGTIATSLPLFGLAWLLLEGEIRFTNIDIALPSILYLGVGGSLLGFACYFYILKKVSATSASIVTLITPVLALCIGNVLNGEIISLNTGVGAGLICFGLLLFNWGGAVFSKNILKT